MLRYAGIIGIICIVSVSMLSFLIGTLQGWWGWSEYTLAASQILWGACYLGISAVAFSLAKILVDRNSDTDGRMQAPTTIPERGGRR